MNPTTIATPPLGHLGFLPAGALSPDQHHLAVLVSGPRQGQAQLVLVDLTTLQATVISNSVLPTGATRSVAQWAPDGTAVFFSAAHELMHDYHLGDGHAITLNLKGSDTFGML